MHSTGSERNADADAKSRSSGSGERATRSAVRDWFAAHPRLVPTLGVVVLGFVVGSARLPWVKLTSLLAATVLLLTLYWREKKSHADERMAARSDELAAPSAWFERWSVST